jgi:hypothetical protein
LEENFAGKKAKMIRYSSKKEIKDQLTLRPEAPTQ